MRNLIVPALALLWGCAPEVDITLGTDLDSDEDGLSDADEYVAGTDPENEDSDGDNHLDGAEIDQGTDPLDAEDHPYAGGWTIDLECSESISATGNAVGEITDNFELLDQHGEAVRLHDFCARAVMLVSGAFW